MSENPPALLMRRLVHVGAAGKSAVRNSCRACCSTHQPTQIASSAMIAATAGSGQTLPCRTRPAPPALVRAKLAELAESRTLDKDPQALRNRCDGSSAHCHSIEALHELADARAARPAGRPCTKKPDVLRCRSGIPRPALNGFPFTSMPVRAGSMRRGMSG